MYRHVNKAIFLLICGLLFFTIRSDAQSFNFTSFDVPCSAAPPTSCPNGIARRTAAGEINSGGDIVGVYTDGVGKQHGFLLSRGQFMTIDVPGALVGASGTLTTVARGIGPSGEIVGQFVAPVNPAAPPDSPAYCPAAGSAACLKGFVYSRGQFSALLFPGHPGAIPGHIAPNGDIYGCYHDFDTSGSMFSAAWTHFGDTSIAAGGGALTDPTLSFPDSMHGGATPDGNVVVGFYGNSTTGFATTHGYILQNGVLETHDVPGSVSTVIWDINPGMVMVGTYVDSNSKQHGFVQLPDGSAPITTDFPNAAATVVQGINAGGAIVGQYRDAGGHTHGFVGMPTGE